MKRYRGFRTGVSIAVAVSLVVVAALVLAACGDLNL